jgi:putative acetyltransferase
MALTIAQEPGDSDDALALLAARDEENFKLYPPEARFGIPAGQHADRGVLFFVARERGIPIGCGALQRHEGYAEMKSVFVLKTARGRRLGQEIIRALEDAAGELGYDDVRLETGVRSPWAIRTYERAGYSRCARFGSYPDAPLSVFMMKRLPSRTGIGHRAEGGGQQASQTSEGGQP